MEVAQTSTTTQPKNKIIAIASFVFGLFFWIPLLNWIFGPIALVLGIYALIQIRKNPEFYSGNYFAIIGSFLGGLIILLNILGLFSQ